jgi:hypothetical protein
MCHDPTTFVDILGDGPPQHIDASCEPEGWFSSGETWGGLGIVACSQSPSAFVLTVGGPVDGWPGQSSMTTGAYQRGGINYGSNGDGTLTITTLEPVGGAIEGSFSMTFTPPAAASAAPIALTGKFRVCHTPSVEGL